MASISPASCNSTLTARVSNETPHFWLRAAAAAGTSGADAFLIHLGETLTSATHAASESAEAARAQLRETRTALHVAIDVRCDELCASIDLAETAKVASLERELVAVDAALDRWQSVSATVRSTIFKASEVELQTLYAPLSSLLDDTEAQLKALPTAVDTSLGITLGNNPSLLRAIACFGCVCSPRPINAADLRFETLPHFRGARLGDTLHMRLSVGARHISCSIEEMEESLKHLMVSIRIDATVEGPGVQPRALVVTLAPDATNRCLVFSIAIPNCFTNSLQVKFVTVSVTGDPTSGLPFSLPVECGGIVAPRIMRFFTGFSAMTPSISPEGLVYCATSFGPHVRVRDRFGAELLGLPLASLGLSKDTASVAYALSDTATPLLLLADNNSISSCLVAVDLTTRAVRWVSAAGSFHACCGIAILSEIVLVSDYLGVYAHRIHDGIRLGTLEGVPLGGCMLAADSSTGDVYGSARAAGLTAVHAWSYTSDFVMDTHAILDDAGTRGNYRPLAVMPPTPGKKVSHLIIGTSGTGELLVLSLPGRLIVHTHVLDFEGIRDGVTGLAADPWGEALAVCCTSSIHILVWPLPGMSLLE